MSNSVLKVYRRFYKLDKTCHSLFRELIGRNLESETYSRTELKAYQLNCGAREIEGLSSILEEYLEMRRFIKIENDLLTSYNINVMRDNRKKLEQTANYCGLRI